MSCIGGIGGVRGIEGFGSLFQMKARIAVFLASIVLAACGGGGGGAGTCLFSCPVAGAGVASDLVVTLDKNVINNDGSQSVTVTVTAVDANRNAVADAPVTIVPDSTALVTASATKTDADGKVTGTVNIGADHSNRLVVVLVNSGSLKKTATFSVIGATLNTTLVPAVVLPGAAAKAQFKLVDANNSPMPNQSITVNGPTTIQATTDVNGSYEYQYTAPPTEGAFTLSATAAGAVASATVTVSSGTVPAAVGPVRTASLSVNPSTISVNSSLTNNQTELRALFLGDNNLPIANLRVRFDLNGDQYGIGGSLTSGSSLVYTDANGIARTSYAPGSRPSGNNKLTLRACWDYNDFAQVASGAACPSNQQVTTTLTVVDSGISVSILTNGKIVTLDPQSVYQLDFAVQVVDSAGQPKSGVTVRGSVDLPKYYKGFWAPGTSSWGKATPDAGYTCENEDINRSGTLDAYSNGQTEDANGTAKLEPRAADVAIVVSSAGSDVTDSTGKAYFHLQYGQNLASWDDITLTFSAIVLGTEGRASYARRLPVPTDATSDITAAPPFALSPYGLQSSSTVVVTEPGSGKQGVLCINPN